MWHFTTHGVIAPKGTVLVKVKEGVNSKGTQGDWIKFNRPLTQEEIEYYDFRETMLDMKEVTAL